MGARKVSEGDASSSAPIWHQCLGRQAVGSRHLELKQGQARNTSLASEIAGNKPTC